MSLIDYGATRNTKVLLKEEETYYFVANEDDLDCSGKLISSGKNMKSKEEFEEIIKREYGTTNVEWVK